MQSEQRDSRIKRLVYQSCNRGCKELDILLGKFAVSKLASFDDNLLDQYEHICQLHDWDLYATITRKIEIPQDCDNEAMDMLLKFHDF